MPRLQRGAPRRRRKPGKLLSPLHTAVQQRREEAREDARLTRPPARPRAAGKTLIESLPDELRGSILISHNGRACRPPPAARAGQSEGPGLSSLSRPTPPRRPQAAVRAGADGHGAPLGRVVARRRGGAPRRQAGAPPRAAGNPFAPAPGGTHARLSGGAPLRPGARLPAGALFRDPRSGEGHCGPGQRPRAAHQVPPAGRRGGRDAAPGAPGRPPSSVSVPFLYPECRGRCGLSRIVTPPARGVRGGVRPRVQVLLYFEGSVTHNLDKRGRELDPHNVRDRVISAFRGHERRAFFPGTRNTQSPPARRPWASAPPTQPCPCPPRRALSAPCPPGSP